MSTETRHLYTVGDVARETGVSRTTVRRWVDQGLIRPDSKTLGGHLRFTAEEIARVLDATRGPIERVLSEQVKS